VSGHDAISDTDVILEPAHDREVRVTRIDNAHAIASGRAQSMAGAKSAGHRQNGKHL